MDPANPRAEAAAIAGDRFLGVGGLGAYVNSLAFEIDSSIRWLKTSAKFARPADRDASVKAFLAGKAICEKARGSRAGDHTAMRSQPGYNSLPWCSCSPWRTSKFRKPPAH